jgi:type I restriction enzyme R subunit
MARQLGAWFHRTFGDPAFQPGPFVPPPDPKAESAALAAELQRLRDELAAQRTAAEAARAAAEVAAEARLTAEQRARKEAEDREIWEALAAEAEKEQLRLAEELAELQAAAVPSPAEAAALVEHANQAAAALYLDEADTRRLIDDQLRLAGWEVDTIELTYGKGARPQKGKNLAIAEWPTRTGPADYVLFVGLQPVAIVEAKRERKDISGSLEQAKRYSRGYTVAADQLDPGGPWDEYKVPFLFATNGRPFLRQLQTKSGIWFLDARRPQNLPRPLEAWYTPDGLVALLRQDIDKAHEQLKTEPTEYLGLRDYQLAAIRAVEAAIETGQRECLVAMATGTGKTRTCIGLTYRLLKTRRFRRVLFLVDRSALGEQAANAYKDARLENPMGRWRKTMRSAVWPSIFAGLVTSTSSASGPTARSTARSSRPSSPPRRRAAWIAPSAGTSGRARLMRSPTRPTTGATPWWRASASSPWTATTRSAPRPSGLATTWASSSRACAAAATSSRGCAPRSTARSVVARSSATTRPASRARRAAVARRPGSSA